MARSPVGSRDFAVMIATSTDGCPLHVSARVICPSCDGRRMAERAADARLAVNVGYRDGRTLGMDVLPCPLAAAVTDRILRHLGAGRRPGTARPDLICLSRLGFDMAVVARREPKG